MSSFHERTEYFREKRGLIGNLVATTFGRVEGRRLRFVHGLRESLMESRWLFFRRNVSVASLRIKELVLGATLSDTGVSVAELRFPADARHQSSIERRIRRRIEASVIIGNTELLFGDKIILKRRDRHLSNYVAA